MVEGVACVVKEQASGHARKPGEVGLGSLEVPVANGSGFARELADTPFIADFWT